MRASTAWLAAAALAGCTLDAGHGFATMREGGLSAQLVPTRARDLDDDGLLTNLGYEVWLTRLQLEVDRVELQELRGGDAGVDVRFDPADPPPGYAPCHGGHCHAEDGSLPSYEEIQASLAGGAASYHALVTMPVAAQLDLLGGESVALALFSPSRELPQGSLDRAEVVVVALSGEAEVRGGDLAEPVRLVIELELDEHMSELLSVVIGRDGPASLAPRVAIHGGGTLFDEIDFAALAGEASVVELDDAALEAGQRLVGALVESEVEVAFGGGEEHGHGDEQDEGDGH
jgi:hypothetical protein